MSKDQIHTLLSSRYFLAQSKPLQQQQKKGTQTFATDEISRLLKLRYLPFSTQKPIIQQPKQPKKQGGKQAKEGKEGKGEESHKFEIKCPKGTRDYYPHQMAIRRKVMDTIVEVFKKHGGVEIDTPIFELKDVLTGKYGEDSKLIYDLEDQGGQKCALRYDLTVPFARFMAMNTNIAKIKRFHIGKVYRRDQPIMTKGRYREFYQCDFDIAGSYDPMIPDAEILSIMQEVLEAVDVKDFLVKVNHRKILEGMIQEAGCRNEDFAAICSSVDKLDKQPWSQIKEELIKQKGVTEEQANIIGQLTQHRGSPIELLQKIRSQNIFKQTGEKLSPFFDEMEKLFSYLKAFDRIGKVSFDLSLARGLDYYTGLIFEIVLTDKTKELGSISGGGRYDNLIGMFCSHQIPSIGGSIGIERLFNIIEEKYAAKVKQNACEVLVATVGKVPMEAKLSILSKLWGLNIKAQTLYQQKCKADKQIKHAFENGIPMILWVGEEELITGDLKLKILYKHDQVSVKLNDLNGSLMPFVDQFRKDFEEGKVVLEDPEKDKKDANKKDPKKKK